MIETRALRKAVFRTARFPKKNRLIRRGRPGGAIGGEGRIIERAADGLKLLEHESGWS
jgi:hypothetical protein